ncbi:MAG: transcriptional regulator [Burkholderiales bacterium]|nr:MAG: transcriptional regulator [Burkholderiales bacterium]
MLLSSGGLRFSELKRSLPGISQRMLTLSLRSLERDGLVTRCVTPTVPARVDYALTALGSSFAERASILGQWAFENRPAVDASREAFDSRLEPSVSKISPVQTRPVRAEPVAG